MARMKTRAAQDRNRENGDVPLSFRESVALGGACWICRVTPDRAWL
ncbi:hypothetical protein [Methylobacterium sp. Leaf466]|nr:hypothetical protein [Methylobacterium sp. Leaf466]